MKSIDDVGITFANVVVGSGSLHGVVNVQLGVVVFENTEDGKVRGDVVECCRLRMDVPCAVALRDALNGVLDSIARSQADALLGAAPAAGPAPNEKPN